MIAANRHNSILEMLGETGAVMVEDLARDLGVSAMTVRRDLDKLEKAGHLQRCHGGAVRPDRMLSEEAYDVKQTLNQSEKMLIARRCAEMVKDGDCVFLDSGTTTYLIASLIKDRRDITIITNDLKIAASLLSSNVSLIVCGGQIQRSTGCAVGQLGIQMLSQLKANLAFIGAACVDDQFCLLTPTVEKAGIKKMAMEIAGRRYLAVDSSKFYRHALVKIAGLWDFTGVVTDREFTPAERKKLREREVNIIPVDSPGPAQQHSVRGSGRKQPSQEGD